MLHPVTVRYLRENALLDLRTVSTSATFHRYLAADGTVLDESVRRYRFTGYNTLYGALLRAFGRERYHLGHDVTGLAQDADGRRTGLQRRQHGPVRPGRGRRWCVVLRAADRASRRAAALRRLRRVARSRRRARAGAGDGGRARRRPDLPPRAGDARTHLPDPELRRRCGAGQAADEPGLVPQRAGRPAARRPAHRPVGDAPGRVAAARVGARRAGGRAAGHRRGRASAASRGGRLPRRRTVPAGHCGRGGAAHGVRPGLSGGRRRLLRAPARRGGDGEGRGRRVVAGSRPHQVRGRRRGRPARVGTGAA